MLTSGTHGNYGLIPPGMNLFQVNNIETMYNGFFIVEFEQ